VNQHNLNINRKRKDFVLADFIAVAEQNSIRNPRKTLAECLKLTGIGRNMPINLRLKQSSRNQLPKL
jgi:hypothetical protein